MPVYRGLHGGDVGSDVRQLNQSLRALGYDAPAEDDDIIRGHAAMVHGGPAFADGPRRRFARGQRGNAPLIALWLGHESVDTTQIYLHADLALKERALAKTTPPTSIPGRYRPPDSTLAFLEAL